MLILLVEPDAQERRKLSRALTLEGYSVRTARDSREAVRLFLAHPADLLLAVHGWIYAVNDGLLRDLGLCVSGPGEWAPAYQAAVAGQGALLIPAGFIGVGP